MRRLLAISFLSLLVLHYVGFYFAYIAIDQRIENSWQARYEKNDFKGAQLQEMSLSISFPYMHDQSEYVNVDELMEIDGKIYRIVKKRYENGTLHLVYVNDSEKEGIDSWYQSWADQVNQKTQATQSSISFSHTIDKHYINNDFIFDLLAAPELQITHFTSYTCFFEQIFLDTTVPPPKFS